MTESTAKLLADIASGDVTAANVASHVERAGGADFVTIEALAAMMPTRSFAAVTPHNSTMLTVPARALYIGGDGNVVAINGAGTAITFTAVKAGTILPIATRRVNSTGTTATGIVAL